MIRARIADLQLAVMLLTRLPAGRLPDPAPAIGGAAWAFPLAGIGPGAIGAVVLAAAGAAGIGPAMAAGFALAAMIIVTGALHEDGLADVADGFWGGRDRDRRLAIMRDSRIGSYGTLAIAMATGLRWTGIAALAGMPAALIAVAMASRVAPVVVMAALPPARGDGMGHAARAAGPVVVAVALGGAVPVMLLPGGALAVGGAVAGVAGLALIARRKIGGQTGDVLGAAQQIAEIALLAGLARAA